MSDLILGFGIDIKNDYAVSHLAHICHKCVRTIANVKGWQISTTIKKERELAIKGNKIWTEFPDQLMKDCTVCHHQNILSF